MVMIGKDDLGNVVWDLGNGKVLNFGGGRRPDGRKRPEVKAHKVADLAGRAVRWYFADGASATVGLDSFGEEMRLAFALHGISQKFGDSYASATTVQEAREAFDGLYGQVMNGEWEKRREGGKEKEEPLLVEALARIYNSPVEAVRPLVEAMKPAERRAMEADGEVARMILAIRAERTGTEAVEGAKAKFAAMLGKGKGAEGDGDDEALM
jgi:hypothetical protein